MSRGWFLLGLLASLCLPMLVDELFRLLAARFKIFTSPSDVNVDLAVAAFSLSLWLSIFPVWRALFRRRLSRRGRPLWWASAPGNLAFIPVALFIGFAVDELSGAEYFTALLEAASISTDVAFVAFKAPIVIGLLLGLILICECLRPDRPIDPAKVFD